MQLNRSITGNQEEVLYKRSFTLKLTQTGFNRQITIPMRLDIWKGELYLNYYCVQFASPNANIPEINLNIHGIDHIESENNRSDLLTLPVSMNDDRTTMMDVDLVLSVKSHKIQRTITYDLIDHFYTPLFQTGANPDTFNPPVAVYLTFEYVSSSL